MNIFEDSRRNSLNMPAKNILPLTNTVRTTPKPRSPEELKALTDRAANLLRTVLDYPVIAEVLSEDNHPLAPSRIRDILSEARKKDPTIPKSKSGTKPGSKYRNSRLEIQKLIDEIKKRNPTISFMELATEVKKRTGKTI